MLLTCIEVETELEALGHLNVDVRTDIVLVVVSSGLVVDTVLILTVELNEVSDSVRTTVDAHTILVLCRDRLDDEVIPVYVRIKDRIISSSIVVELSLIVEWSCTGDGE